jgi:hypothetical protein
VDGYLMAAFSLTACYAVLHAALRSTFYVLREGHMNTFPSVTDQIDCTPLAEGRINKHRV